MNPSVGVLGTALLKRALAEGTPEVLDAAIEHLRAAVRATPAGDLNAPVWRSNLGAALRTRYRRTELPADLDEAIGVLRRAVMESDPTDPCLVGRLGNLGLALCDRFEQARDQRDLVAAVDTLERAFAMAGPDQRIRQTGNLMNALVERYRSALHPEDEDLDRAVALGRGAAADGIAEASSADHATVCGNLAAALYDRFEQHGKRADFDDALAAATAAVASTGAGDPKLAAYLSTLGTLLHTRFVLTGKQDDLNESITTLTTAERRSRAVRGGRALVLAALGSALLDRYRWLGDAADLDTAIEWQRAALELTPDGSPDLAVRLSNLAVSLAERAQDRSDLDTLEESLRIHDRAVRLAGSAHPQLASIVANRGSAFLIRFSVRGDVADCSAAVAAYRQALELVKTDRPERSGYLAQLGQSLRARHQATGRTDDLYEAVTALREAAGSVGPAHRDHSHFCSLLGAALLARHLWHGSAEDLQKAIEWHDRAAAGLPGEQWVGKARLLASRAFALRIRAQRTRDRGEVSAAIDACRQAVEAETDAARLPNRLATLGAALDLRRDTVAEVTETIAVRRRACELAAPDEPYRGPWLADLGNSLRTRAALRAGEAGDDDLREAHSLHLRAVESTSPEHPEYATVLSNLAGSFRDHYVRFDRHSDLLAAIDRLRRAAELPTAPMTRRLVAAQTWGRLAADTGQWAVARDGYITAIALLPAAAWRGADRAGQEQPLRDLRWLAAEAAACALKLDDPLGAVDLLERGRTILWNQRLETATDLRGLRDRAPDLADRLDDARAVLDAVPGVTDAPPSSDVRIAAAADWDAVMTEIRNRPELVGLLPGPGSTRLPTDVDGTVVLLVVNRYRQDAILLDRGGARTHELTGLDLGTLAEHVENYFGALATLVNPKATTTDREAGEAALRDLLRWLWEAVAATVVNQVPAGSRVWWCPTGPLTYLPLHAAGEVPDRVVSSYTPTVAALIRAQQAPAPAEQRVLGVAVPKAPGLPPLPDVQAELDQLATVLPAGTPLTRLEGPSASRDAVRTALREHTWAHLACHGEQNLAQPAQAALVLTDGRLCLEEITTRFGHHAEGAYLSACQTALGGVELTDEVLHLAAALQFAGFRRVIATLWPVHDSRARAIARRIYRSLAAGGTFHPDRSAAAVREATLALRDRSPDAPSQWAPFVHFGP